MKILDLEISNADYSLIAETIHSKLQHQEHFSFLNVNAYIAVRAMKKEELNKNLKQFSSLFADGIGIFLASKLLYGNGGFKKRINGTDLYYKILQLAEKFGYRVFFFGGDAKSVEVLSRELYKKYPKLIISGIIMREELLSQSILEMINRSSSHILFLGLGTPHQERWIAKYSRDCNVPIQICVGSGIDFLSGTYQRAPKILRGLGLEWIYRLIKEPSRLWKRYILGIPIFIFLIVKQKLSKKNIYV